MSESDRSNQPWWVLRWLDLLEKYRFKKRLERGRNYAQTGNIRYIEFREAEVWAQVQGSAEDPYQLSIRLDPFSDRDWDNVIATLAERASLSTQLLAGELPQDIEAVFTANGLSLFPFSLKEVRSRCNCPDPKNPCKHVAAVYYELGDRFSEDPFVLFRLRGRTRKQILDGARQVRARKMGGEATPATAKGKKAAQVVPSQLPLDIEHFWQYEEPLDPDLVAIEPSSEETTVLALLGSFPLTASDARAVQQYLTRAYKTASERAVAAAAQQAGGSPQQGEGASGD